ILWATSCHSGPLPFASLVTGRIGCLEIAQELVLRIQHNDIPFAIKGILVGLHAPIELIKVPILTKCLGIGLRSDRITLTPSPLSFGKGFGQDHCALTISISPDPFCQLITPGAMILSLFRPLSFHPLED